MKITHILGYALTSFLLLISGILIKSYALWSNTANHTLPWLCSMLAIILLINCCAGILSNKLPCEMNRMQSMTLCTIISIIFGLALWADFSVYQSYGSSSASLSQILSSAGEWLSFTVLLFLSFLLPKLQLHSPFKRQKNLQKMD